MKNSEKNNYTTLIAVIIVIYYTYFLIQIAIAHPSMYLPPLTLLLIINTIITKIIKFVILEFKIKISSIRIFFNIYDIYFITSTFFIITFIDVLNL
jgi:hypothetical protein